MIRMGKSLKQSSSKSAELQEQSPTSVLSKGDGGEKHSEALSESERMARDIKEGRLSGFVGSGTVSTGETLFQAMLRIDGHVKGEIKSEKGTLIIGATGRVDASIHVGEAIINGLVNGDIVVANKLSLGRSAKIVGNVQAPRLIMEDGAIMEGNCSMIQPNEKKEKRVAKSRHQSTSFKALNQTKKPALTEKSVVEMKKKEQPGTSLPNEENVQKASKSGTQL